MRHDVWVVEECVDDGGGLYHWYALSGPLPELEALERKKTCSPTHGGWIEINPMSRVTARALTLPEKEKAWVAHKKNADSEEAEASQHEPTHLAAGTRGGGRN